MTKRVLFTATVVKTHIMSFHLPYLKWFQEQGYETWVAAKNDYEDPTQCSIPYCDHFVNIDFERSPFSTKNISAYRKLKELIENKKFDIIHCHTPVAAILTRKAAKDSRKKGISKVLYTAHGFHFYQGAPMINWLLFYPLEKHYARYTDTIITMNQEDFENAKKFPCSDIRMVNGVGIDVDKIKNTVVDRKMVRENLGINPTDFLLLSVGELVPNKNHLMIIKAIEKMNKQNVKYVICGEGRIHEELEQYIQEQQLSNAVKLLGFRKDIIEIGKSSDCFVFPSIKEGLPVSVMEAMACGLPCVVSNIRGNRDLVVSEKGGLIVEQNVDSYCQAIQRMINRPDERLAFSEFNQARVENYDFSIVLKQMTDIYTQFTK